MQSIQTLTRELGASLQLCPQYVRFVAARETNDADEALSERMQALELVRMQYRHEAAKKDAADAVLMGQYNADFEALYDEIMGNENMREYNEAAAGLNTLLKWITAVIQGCAQGEDPSAYEPEQAGCGGQKSSGCGGCKGCG